MCDRACVKRFMCASRSMSHERCCGDAGSNVVSVAEHVVMMILSLVRNYIPAYHQVIDGEWNIAKIAEQ